MLGGLPQYYDDPIELLNINKVQELYQPYTLVSPKLLFKNKSNEPIIIDAFQAKKDIKDPNIIILEKGSGALEKI